MGGVEEEVEEVASLFVRSYHLLAEEFSMLELYFSLLNDLKRIHALRAPDSLTNGRHGIGRKELYSS